MVVSAFVLVSSCADRPSATGDCDLLRGDNEAAVMWVRRCRGGLETRSGALMRLLGALEVSSGWHFEARMCLVSTTMPPTVSLAGIAASVLHNSRAVRRNIPWQDRELGTMDRELGTMAFLGVLRCWPRTHATGRRGLYRTSLFGAF